MIRFLICAVVSLALAVNESAGQVSLRTVALSGDQAAGLPSGVRYLDFIYSRTYGEGKVVFSAHLTGTGVNSTNSGATFNDRREDGISVVVRTGDQAPGLPEGTTYYVSGPPRVNDAGQVAFPATLRGDGFNSWNDTAVYSDAGDGRLRLIAQSGEQVNGLPAGTLFETIPQYTYADFHLNNEGRIALDSKLLFERPSRDSILRADSDGDFELLATQGIPIPGTQFEQYSVLRQLQFNNTGEVAFVAVTNLPDSSSEVLLSDRRGQGIQVIARRGDQAPGLPAGFRLNGVLSSSVRLSDSGGVAFATTLKGNANPSSYDTAVFRNDIDGGTTLIARSDDQVLGLAEGVVYDGLYEAKSIQLNDVGEVAFVTGLRGIGVDASNKLAIVRGSSTADTMVIARTGDQVPGLPSGVIFAGFDSDNLRINNTGATLFAASIRDGDYVSKGIFSADLKGDVSPVITSFQMFDINEDPQVSDLRQIVGFGDSPFLGDDFSDSGTFSFRAQFAGGLRGLLVAQIATPLPGDYNSDGLVNAADYTVWRDALNSTTQLAADGDGNGQIDQSDFTVWSEHYGAGHNPSSNAAPEPNTVSLLLATGLLVICRPTKAC